MATRLKFPVYGIGVNEQPAPTVDAAWGVVRTNLGKYKLRRSPCAAATAVSNPGLAETSASAINGVCQQYISEPISAQTISGFVRGVFKCREDNAAADMRSQLVVRVVSEDASVVRGTLLAADDASGLSSEWAAAGAASGLASRRFPPPATWDDVNLGKALSSVVCQDGDRIVVEVGYRSHNVDATSRSGFIQTGDSGTDLLDNETQTGTGGNPWVEFSQDITFPAYDRGTEVLADDFTGTNGDPWNAAKWTLASQASGSNPDIQGNEGRMRVAAVAASMSLAVAQMTDILDTDVVASWRFPATTADCVLLIWTRTAGTFAAVGDRPTGPGIAVEWWNNRGQVKLITQKVDGDQTQIDSASTRMAADTIAHWVRFRTVDGEPGGVAHAKFWTGLVTDEPLDWDIDWDPPDPTYIPTVAGDVELFLNHESNGPWEAFWDSVSISEVGAAGQTIAVAQAIETDTAEAITPRRIYTLGQATETDTAEAVTPLRAVPVGQAVETDTAFPITPDLEGQQTIGVGQALETDTAGAVTARRDIPVGQAIETDTAGEVTHRKTVHVGQATETDSALPISGMQATVVIVGLAVEGDTALVVRILKRNAAAQRDFDPGRGGSTYAGGRVTPRFARAGSAPPEGGG